ncbi:MAG: UPF0182 family protein [Candidatus Margulisiibacteriota bacterium]
MRNKFYWPLIISGAFILWFLLQSVISLYPSLLWFSNLGFSSVFWINLKTKFLVAFVFGLLCFLILYGNFLLARYLGRGKRREKVGRKPHSHQELRRMMQQLFGEKAHEEDDSGGMINITPEAPGANSRTNLIWAAGIGFFALITGFGAITQWQVVLKALNAVSFGMQDPVFFKDIGFYLFSFPLLQYLQGFLFTSCLISLCIAVWIYLLDGSISFSGLKLDLGRGAKSHLYILAAALVLLFAWGLWLGELQVLYSTRGVVFGAGYTDVKAQILGYNLQIYLLVILAALVLYSIFRKTIRLPLIGLGIYLLIAVVMGGIYPAILQNFQVKPNEITLESPYIANNIKFTRLAYGLDKIEEREFPVDQDLSLKDLQKNNQTIDNIRLWDPRPLLKTYRQLQGIRTYYDFLDVDVDRYDLNGSYKQVMLSPREIDITRLAEQAQTWVNQHLIFTHGYGACMSPVSKQTPEGLPDLIVKDIPPVSTTDLKIDRPEIYYGESTDNYVIVNTTEKEFDYPRGDKNVYASYQGRGGVQINSLLRRLAFAIKFSDLKILLTDYITDQSRVMFDRSIAKRVSTIAPFLRYDRDPYLVVVEGKMYWILDAYAATDLFPYSTPYGEGYDQFNYIRNSVKVVVDAYNGDITFYVIDPNDPLTQVYQKIYPDLFRPFSLMPEGIKRHLRYPYDLFMIQSQKYALYHMQEPQVFYNQEDLWNIPNEIYVGSEKRVEAYYIIMKLPEERSEEFLLMLPFTPNQKDNMIAWLAGRSDMPNYGKLMVYKFPKEKLIYGPMQIEARIDQQTEISQQFTLWGQLGSRVLRGNLLAIPIENSIIYVEPVFLEAASGELPELKRVIVSYNKNVVMRESLESSLSAVFSGRVSTTRTVEKGTSLHELARQGLAVLNQATSNLRAGDFGGFGGKLDDLRKILQQMVQ